MKILLVIPRYGLTTKKNYGYSFPIGLGYISSVLKQANHEVDCLNLNHLEGITEKLIREQLNKKKYDIVCSGHLGIGYAIIEKITKASRNHPSKPKIILGGALITSEPKLMLQSLKPDFIVIGEGEITILELLKELQKNKSNFSKIKGIGYVNKNKELIFTKPRELISDLDSLPLPDFTGFGFEEKLDNSGNEDIGRAFDYPRAYPILCSRGCPFHCTFCYHSLGDKYRTRTIEDVIKEIEIAIKKYKINGIFIYDDLFSLNKERLYDFCKKIKKLIKKTPWDIKWTCQFSVLHADKKTLKMLKDSGCYVVGFGFESYSQKILQSMRKPITPKQIDNAIKASKEAGITIQGNFILGDIEETKETAYTTLNYWKKTCESQIRIGFIQPYPGSEVYNHCIRKGIIKDKLDFIKNHMAHTNFINMTNHMTDKEFLQLKKDTLNAIREQTKQIIPLKVERIRKNRYNLKVKCPFCNQTLIYKNFFFRNRFFYRVNAPCRRCDKRIFIVSRLYKFIVDHYNELEIPRKTYLSIQDRFLKKIM